MRYRLLALDLDGTLLGRSGRPSAANLAAVARAQEAGCLVAPCTGRAWREARLALTDFPSPEIGVFVTGAAVSDLTTGRTVDLACIEPHLALEVVERLVDLPEAVLICQDADLTGHDYLVTGRGTLTPNTQWWFQSTGARVRFERRADPDLLHHTLRVGIVADARRVWEVTERLKRDMGQQVEMHYFEAVQQPDPKLNMYVMEVFARGVDKWRGLTWIAGQRGIRPEQIAVIGDEINDIAMLKGAGCGIAMGNAIDSVKQAADHVTGDCDADGVAQAIDALMDERW